jgi:hypothetical protein
MKNLLLLTALTTIALQSRAADIDGATIAMDSLMTCQESRTNGQTMSEMVRKKHRPIRKGEATWTYAAKGTVTTSKGVKLPIKEVVLGVCDLQGHTGCGWAFYRSLVISDSVAQVKAALLKAHGIDYTHEKRDAESGAPVRAILSKTDKPGESMLYCDSGNL